MPGSAPAAARDSSRLPPHSPLNSCPARQIRMSKIWTPPALVVVHPTLFTSSEIDLYEKQILANKNATEHDASKFFAKFPKFLYLGSAAEIRREVVLTSDGKQETQ